MKNITEITKYEGSSNLTWISTDGSPGSTQIWEDGSKGAARRLIQRYKDGLDKKRQIWYSPVIHAYIYSHSTKETYFVNFEDSLHIAKLLSLRA